MHQYGDKDFTYWDELDQAAEFIGRYCRKWGRICVSQYKEKYGTVRVYCHLGWYELGELISPSTICYARWPWYTKWVWRVRIPSWFNCLFFPWQRFIYRRAYKLAIQKWPMIRKEILCCADWDEYLEGL